ncbi:MAG: hypothetical protein Q4G22_12580 [Paracoccus sp. (in: a-proteobacteria)]|uniref:hypothetical protein n=1 Tax=Paracoccus sp. TaxID=267 RepID=UPI0026E013B1|nr:hypothetical protein [Paracoccus sp. (in: a-proteobacteria)]MDO5632654.1 hypothetical protein [Paracoccus sp. (in: a-proteobacteria)]
MAYSNKIAEMLAQANETDKVEFAHFLANNLDAEECAHDSARVREFVAAFDRFAAPKRGEHF